jgi:hypothetical protein
MKKRISRIVLFFLGRAFQVLYRRDANIRREVDDWNPGFAFCMKVSREGPGICLMRTEKGMERQKKYEPSRVNMTVEFRSIDAAFLVLSGRIGIAQAYSQHRFTMRGSISSCMTLVYCVDIIEGYLFPKLIARKILKKLPQKQISTVSTYWHAILNN